MTDALTMKPWPAGASQDYIAARENLIEAERALLDHVRQVADLRRRLPLGPAMAEYTFTEGPRDLTHDDPVTTTTLADLVGDHGLLVYHMMWPGPNPDEGCPSCSMWVDGLNGVAHHLAQVTNFVVIAKAPLPRLRAWARRRRWSGLRLLSSLDSTFNADIGAEDPDGGQWPTASTFTKQDGIVYHRYTVSMVDNALDLLSPVWHAEDLLPQGRGTWEPSNA